MRSMDCARALITVAACIIPPLSCTRSTPAPPSVPRASATPLSVFTDTAQYRRYCVVPAGQPVDLNQPCLLLDQGRAPGRPTPGRRPPAPRP